MQDIIITKNDNIEYLQFKKLLEFEDKLIHAYSLKTHRIGFRRGGRNYTADESYNKICMSLGINRAFVVHPDQMHTDTICEYKENDTMSLSKTDGIITDIKNIATVLTFADCMSFFMYDPITNTMANIHSGWKGTVKRIGEKAIDKLQKNYGVKTQNLICCFGPCIHKDHFLVNSDVSEIFELEFPNECKKFGIVENTEYEKTVKKVLEKCFEEEGLMDSKLIITVTFTNPEEIRKINKKYRKIDKATDVLSFPMFEKEELEQKIASKDFLYEDMLGDLIISIEKVKEQAIEYGHSFERELSYMLVHGFYHLMGYDHIEEEDKKKMRPKEEKILNELKITRD